MHAITPPELFDESDSPPTQRARAMAGARDIIRQYRGFLLVVLLPSLLASLYVGVIVSNQYVSETHFVVRAAGTSQGTSSGIEQLLGINQVSASQTESLALGDYLTSHDAAAVLERRLGLSALFQRPDVDYFSRLRTNAPPETLLKFYRNQIEVNYSSETGITTMKVRAFRPDDALRIASLLLDIGENRVNQLNQRAYDDALKVTRGQLADAERDLTSIQSSLTRFRQGARDIDPVRSSAAQIELVSSLRANLAGARAQLAGMAGAVSPSSPQYRVMQDRVNGLAVQVAREDARLTGGNRAMAAGLSAYEELQLRQDFAAKRYSAAAATLEAAREQAVRQQLFVIRVVEPNRPVKSLYPRRLWTIASIIVGLLLVYGIGWLIVAGVREHAA
jgi:capsular polysaccharide transport system permease protein